MSMCSERGVTAPRAAWQLSGRAESHTRNGGHAGILVVKDIGISTLQPTGLFEESRDLEMGFLSIN